MKIMMGHRDTGRFKMEGAGAGSRTFHIPVLKRLKEGVCVDVSGCASTYQRRHYQPSVDMRVLRIQKGAWVPRVKKEGAVLGRGRRIRKSWSIIAQKREEQP